MNFDINVNENQFDFESSYISVVSSSEFDFVSSSSETEEFTVTQLCDYDDITDSESEDCSSDDSNKNYDCKEMVSIVIKIHFLVVMVMKVSTMTRKKICC